MKLGIFVRVAGPEANRELLLQSVQTAEAAGIDDAWIFDHVAIPREESEGSEGYYLDCEATLAFLAGATERIGLGTAVLLLPFRDPLHTARWAATLQVLSEGRLRLGVGVGWMEAEFRVLGIPRNERGARTDASLAFMQTCFENDEVERNGQKFLFRPRPEKPEILVGGNSPAARRRAARYGDAWLPIGLDSAALVAGRRDLERLGKEFGRPIPEIVFGKRLPIDAPAEAGAALRELEDLGVTSVVHMAGAKTIDEFRREVDALAALR
jgi:probable F420-dependent oxidoreductase